jgi:hypothetical protein
MDVTALRTTAIAAIEAAFPLDPVPEVDDVRNDHCPECAELAARFSGKRWDEIALADLARNPSASLLTPVAFRYYLPAMMLRSMEDPRALDTFPYSLVSELSPPGGKPSPDRLATYAGLTTDQATAIIAFLRHYELCQAEETPDDRAGRRVVTRALKCWGEVAGGRAL